MRIPSIRAFAVVKNGKINATDIYNYNTVSYGDGEMMVTVLIVPLIKHKTRRIKRLNCVNCGELLLQWKQKYCGDACEREYKKNN